MSDFSPDDAAYLTADKHKNKHSSSEGGERKRSSSKKQPKGILKNSNPHATYLHDEGHQSLKSGRNKRVEELVEMERPKGSQSSGQHGHGHGHSHSHKKHRRDSLRDDSESSGGSSSPRTSSSSERHHSSSSKKHSKRNAGDHHHECNGSSSRSSSSTDKHKEQRSLERKSHKHSNEGEKHSKKRNNEHNEQRHRQTSDSDTLESTKSTTSGGKHREKKSSKHRHTNSDHNDDKPQPSSHNESSSKKHRNPDSINGGGTFTKEEGRKISRDAQLMEDDEEVDLTSTFKNKNQRRNKTKEQSSSKDISNRDSVDLDNIEDLYDRPKIPPVRYIPDDKQAQNTTYQEDEERVYKDDHSKTRSKIRKNEELENDNGDTIDAPLYKTVVKTSKKNVGGKTGDNTRKPSRQTLDQHEEEFIDSLQAADVLQQTHHTSINVGGFYENVGFGNPMKDNKENIFTSTYVEEGLNGDDSFITVGEALSSSTKPDKIKGKYSMDSTEKNLSNDISKNVDTAQPLYDVPRSNPRRVSPTSLLQSSADVLAASIPPDFTTEAVYVNDGYANDIISSMMDSVNEDQLLPTFDQYDVPRSNNNKSLSDLIPQEYDVPKNRDSLSTIEEEHQEYDIPKPLLDLYVEKKYEASKRYADVREEESDRNASNFDKRERQIEKHDEHTAINDPFENNLYENQKEIFQNSSDENIYANDDAVVNSDGGGNTNLCHSHSSDDRSSGYRSSSSPSIQSEELYVNELALANNSSSLEDAHSTSSSGNHSASSPELIHHNFAQTRILTPVGNTIRKENNLDNFESDNLTWERKSKLSGNNRNDNSFGRSSKNKKIKDTMDKYDVPLNEGNEKERSRQVLEKEIIREKEREKAEEVEREILRKREDNNVNNNNANNGIFNVSNQLKGHVDVEEANADDMFVLKHNSLNKANLKPPETYFTESSKAKKKNEGADMISEKYNDSSIRKRSLKKKAPSIPKDFQNKISLETTNDNNKASSLKKDKDRQQKDRSVDVYNETVRQRVSRAGNEDKSVLSKHVFQKAVDNNMKDDGFNEEHSDEANNYENDKDENIYVNSANIHNLLKSASSSNTQIHEDASSQSQQRKIRTSLYSKHSKALAAAFQDIDDDDLPSVRQLRSRFEIDKKENAITASTPQLNVTKKKPPKFAFKASKKAYNVMFSLTRRSAMSMSKSLQNINVSIDIDDSTKDTIDDITTAKTKDSKNKEHDKNEQNNYHQILDGTIDPLDEEPVRNRASSTHQKRKEETVTSKNHSEPYEMDTLHRLSSSKTVEKLSSQFESAGTTIRHTRSTNKLGRDNGGGGSGENKMKSNREKKDPFDSQHQQSSKKKVRDMVNDDGCNGTASSNETLEKSNSNTKYDNNNSEFNHDDYKDVDASHANTITATFGNREDGKSRNSSTMNKIINDTENEELENEPVARNGMNNEVDNRNSLKRHVDRGTNRDWNPASLVSLLYQIEGSDDDNAEIKKESISADTKGVMEGYLERLPPGKKKSTIWNSWKRQYFVTKGGLLLVFSDSSCAVLMDRIELCRGGRVDFMESTMLGVQDRRGHYIVIKCESESDAKSWERALSAQTNQDTSAMFVSPKPSSPSMYTNVLVIDFGGSSVRAGIASKVPTLPQLFFPAVMAVAHDNEDEKYFGLDAFASEVRSRCQLRHPMIPARTVDKFSIDPIALQGIMEKIFKDLGLDHPGDYEVQLSAPRPFGDRAKCTIAGLLFEEFGVKAVNMAHQSVFAMYAYNSSNNSGVVVDLGERMDVVPIVDGYKVSAGVSRSAVGGVEMRNKLQHYLLGRNYSLTTFIDGYITRYAIENLSYMARNFDRELQRCQRNPEKITRELSIKGCPSIESGILEMGSERFEASEGLFKPELWGLDQAGVHVLVHKAIRECGVDMRKEMTQNIFLAGGLTLIPGFRERLELEVERLNPSIKPIVHASPYRYHAAYIGACVNAASSAFNQTKITRNDFVDAGRRLNKLWTL